VHLSEADHLKLKDGEQWGEFDNFARKLNEVIADFRINVHLTRSGFLPRLEEKIMQGIYEPVLKILSAEKWREVNDHLRDAFAEFQKNTDQGFSICLTNTVSALEAFLQILVNGKTGKGQIAELITKGQRRHLIPEDSFSQSGFKNILSVLMTERQKFSIAHPKKEYANAMNCQLILDLTMVFIRHCLIGVYATII
jgi:hypothetical protein